MTKKAHETLKQFKPIERNIIIKYYELWSIHETICNLWNVNSKELDNCFNYVKDVKIPMYENNSSFRNLINKYQSLILVA